MIKTKTYIPLLIIAIGIIGMMPIPAFAVSGAVFTTTNPAVDNSTGTTNLCLNGGTGPNDPNVVPAIDCNIYTGKDYVWLTGGPGPSALADGTYFFAVLVPGGQPNPNDGGEKNLADLPSGDAYTNREFTVTDGTIGYSGTHDFANGEIRLMPYDDTTNPGGVYIMATCSLAKGYPVNPSDCKYDAFKVKSIYTSPPVGLIVVKNVDSMFNRTYNWSIEKSVDKTLVKNVGGVATFNYTVNVTNTGFIDSAWQVFGTITVTNPNDDPVTGVNITDTIDDANTSCSVVNGNDVTIPGNSNQDFSYICTYLEVPSSNSENNTVVATWIRQTLSNGELNSGSDSFIIPFSFGEPTNVIDDNVTVTDSFVDGLGTVSTLGTVSISSSPATFTYQRTVNIPQFDCRSYDNTATFITDDTETTGSDSRTVTVCGPANTGALTIGFWQNKNGQAIIKNGVSTAGISNVGTWLRQYAPFQDLSATATNNNVAAYVYNTIKAANAAGASMNTMLKGQMLATALNVYFSDPALGGNKINAPLVIGNEVVDLTMICKDLTCSTYEDASGAFGGASSLTISQILTYAASQSDAGGLMWYSNVKETQELAKDTFDAINNMKVFSP